MTHYEIDNLAKDEMLLVKADTIEEAKRIAKDTPSSKWEYRACNYDPKKDSMYEIYWLDLDEEGDIIEIKLIEQCDSLDVEDRPKFRVYQKLEVFVYCDVEANSKEEALSKMPVVKINDPAPWHLYEQDGVETISVEAKAL